MTRKIKSKKHRGIKDPLSHYNQSIEKVKDKINRPPDNADVQEIPKKFQAVKLAAKKVKKDDRRLKKRQQLLLEAKKRKKKLQNALKRKKRENNPYGSDEEEEEEKELINTADFVDKKVGWYPKHGRPFKPIPAIKQEKGEPDYVFRRRLKAVTDAVIYESKFMKKFDVDIQRDDHGEVTQIIKNAGEKTREKRRLRDKERKLKLQLKKQKKNPQKGDEDVLIDDIDEKEKQLFRKDTISFGEVVHRPPQLETTKLDKILKNQKTENKNYLFIQNLKKSSDRNSNATSQLKISKKDIERERQAAVSAYRRQKALALNTMHSPR